MATLPSDRKLRRAFEEFEKGIARVDPLTPHLISLINLTQQLLSKQLGLRSFITSGSIDNQTGVYAFSDRDFIAYIPKRSLSSDPATSLRILVACLQPVTNAGFGVKLDYPAVVLWHWSDPTNRIDVIPAISGYDLGPSSPFINVMDEDQVLFFPGSPTAWLPTAPQAHKKWLDNADRMTSGYYKRMVRLIKSWKYNCDVPIISYYIEVFISRWLDNTHMFSGNLGDVLEKIRSVKGGHATQQYGELTKDIGTILSDLHTHLLSQSKTKKIPSMFDPCIPNGWSFSYSCHSVTDLQSILQLTKEASRQAREARQNEEKGKVEQALKLWENFFG